jgi:hypothetical protein
MSLAFADAHHLGFVQPVEFVLISALLSVEPFAQLQQLLQSGIWRRHFATEISDDSPQPRSQFLQLPTPRTRGLLTVGVKLVSRSNWHSQHLNIHSPRLHWNSLA